MNGLGKGLLVALLGSLLAMNAFGMGGKDKAGASGDGTIKVGLSFSDFEVERWPIEAEKLQAKFEALGAKVFTQAANHDIKLQNDQIDNLVLQGVDVLLIVAEDGAAVATAVDAAKKDGVKVIAYDRLIKSPNLDAYIAFDSVEVGRQQARGILKKMKKGNFALLAGSPTDNNAVLFRKGELEVLQPLINKGTITVVGDQWVENWQPSIATAHLENMLTANSNKIDAVVAMNDGIALGAIEALRAQGLAGKVPITGMDATLAGIKSILRGELTLTVLKDIRDLMDTSVEVAMKLVQGKKVEGLKKFSLAELTNEKDRKGDVLCKFLDVTLVTKDNIYETIVESGFQDYDQVYEGVPKSKRPPRPKKKA